MAIRKTMREKRIVEIKVVSNAGREFDKAGKGAKGAAGGFAAMKTAAIGATGAIGRMTAALLANPFTAIAVALAGLVAGIKNVITVASDFDFEMDKVRAITAATDEEIVKLSKDAQRLGATTEYTAVQVAQLQIEFSKLGFSTQGILNATEATLDLATATGTDLATAAATTGAALNAFGLDTSETATLMDVMAKSFSSSALDMSKFSVSVANTGVSASQMGISLQQATAAMSVLSNAGIDSSKIGTDLRKIFLEVGKTTKEDFRTSLDILAEQMAKTGDKTERMAILTEAVGQRAASAMAILIEQREVLDDLTVSYENANGAAGKMAATMRDNLTTDIKILKSAWDGLLLSIDSGEGFFSTLLRGSIQKLSLFLVQLKDNVNWLGTVGVAYIRLPFESMAFLFKKIEIVAYEATWAVKDFLGMGGDAKQRQDKMMELKNDLNGIADGYQAIINNAKAAYKATKNNREDEVIPDAPPPKPTDTVIPEADPEAQEEIINKVKAFREKLTKMIEDSEDKNEVQRLERKKQRHLKELDQLGLDVTARKELELQISQYYDNLIAANKEKTSKYYADQIDAYDAEQAEKKAKREEEHQKKMISLRDQALDSMAQAFGEETAAAKAVHAFKTALKIKEILLEAGLIKAKAGADQAETVAEANKGGAKALGSGNPLKIALAVAAIGAVVATSIRSMKKTKSAADQLAAKAGGSAGGAGGSSAPSFNVIGATTAGENMIAENVANSNSKPMKAYVLESEVRTAQEMQRKVDKVASL